MRLYRPIVIVLLPAQGLPWHYAAAMTADELIKSLRLTPHPEGGFFRETFRAEGTIARNALPNRFGGDRVFSTSIYYLLRAGQVSRLHRIRSDELWYFHIGDALEVIDITGDGVLTTTVLGHDVAPLS